MLFKNKHSMIFISMLVLLMGFVGCVQKDLTPPQNTAFVEVINAEDVQIIEAYVALDAEDYVGAKIAFMQAYIINPDPSYLREILGILVAQNDLDNAKKKAYAFLEQYPEDEIVRSVLIGILTNEKDFEAALQEANTLLKYHKNSENYELLSSVYFLRQDYQLAVEHLKRAYSLNPSPLILDKLAATHLLFLKDSKTAISLYEAHIKKHGITKPIGDKLAAIYLESQRPLEAAQIYTLLFEELNVQDYAHFTLEIYVKHKRLDLAKSFLLKHTNIDARDTLLFEIYRLQKDTKNSIKQAEILYQNTQDINFLAYKAMLSYENTKTYTKTYLQTIEKDLKEAAQKTNDALYWNYLGYLMIDHDFYDIVRIKEGIEYVQNALAKEPSNSYYLDSLAWGYFKLKDCKKAKETMEKIPINAIQNENELKTHYEKILQCKEN